MKLLGNKFFLFGTIFFLLVSIPLTLFLVKRQQDTRSQAAGETATLSLSPGSLDAGPGDSFKLTVNLNPGDHQVHIVRFRLIYDSAKFDVTQNAIQKLTNGNFNETEKLIEPNGISYRVTLNSNDPTKALQGNGTTAPIAEITFVVKAGASGSDSIRFDPDQSQTYVYTIDGGEDFNSKLAGTTPSQITIAVAPTATPTVPASATATPTIPPAATATPTVPPATATPTVPAGATATPTNVPGATATPTTAAGTGATATPTRTPTPTTTASAGTAATATSTQIAQATSPTPTLAPAGDIKTTFMIMFIILFLIAGGIFLLAL